MKFLMLVFFVGFAALEHIEKPPYDLRMAENLFEKFERDFNKQYKHELDRGVHFEAFKKSLEDINRLNEQHPHITFDINIFADETAEEFKKHLKKMGRISNSAQWSKNMVPRTNQPVSIRCFCM